MAEITELTDKNYLLLTIIYTKDFCLFTNVADKKVV